MISKEVAFSKIVNSISDTASEIAIMYGRYLSLTLDRLPPIITGRTGRTHGASTVKIPAKKAIIRSIIEA